jgi:hypothetical protein
MGGGSVASAPAGISCGGACSSPFDFGTSVTLTPTANSDSSFMGWSGDCTGAGSCTVTMDGTKTVAASFAVHGSKRWVAQIGFPGQDSIEKVVVDPSGDVIAAGTVVADTSNSNSDLFIVKYAANDGHVIWMQRFATATGEDLGGLATDAAGDIYISTRLSALDATPVMFGTTPVTGDLFGNIVVLRLSAASGNVVWAKQWGGSGQDIPQALAVSGNDLYVVGYTSSNPSVFDSKSIMASTNNGFVVRASITNGTAAELKLIPGTVDLLDVAVNGGHIAVVGSVASAVTLDGPCALSPSGAGNDAMIIDLLAGTLACQWAKNFGDFVNNNNAAFQAVAAYPGGGWAVTGDFQGNILLAPSGTSLTSHGGFDVVAGRFTGDGTHVWSFRYGDTGFDIGYGIGVTPQGNVVLAGVFDTTITFGTLTVTGKNNAFVTRMSASNTPTHEWAVSLGGDDSDLTNGAAVAPDGSVYVVSSFTGMTNIGGTPLTSQDIDAWVAALVR